MSSLLIKATDLSIGDTLLLPFNKTATVSAIKAFGPKSVYVNFKTEYGWTRVDRNAEFYIEAKAL